MKSQPGPPMTLGNAAAARVRLIVWCKDCRHQVEPDPAEMAARTGTESSTVATVTPYRGSCILTYPTKKPTRSRKSYTTSSSATATLSRRASQP
jgi:hypothetical protein